MYRLSENGGRTSCKKVGGYLKKNLGGIYPVDAGWSVVRMRTAAGAARRQQPKTVLGKDEMYAERLYQ